MKKILVFAIILSWLTPLQATARTIRLREKTNDGATLSLFTTAEPATQSGWTVFKYGVEKGASFRENIGVTPYCYQGKLQRNQSVSTFKLPVPGWATAEDIDKIRTISSVSRLSDFIKKLGWIVDLSGKVSEIHADSLGSRALLNTVCRLIK